MIDLFDAPTRAALLERLGRLRSDSPRQWWSVMMGKHLDHHLRQFGL